MRGGDQHNESDVRPADGTRRRWNSGSVARRREAVGWALLAPAVAVVAMVGLYPLGRTFWASLTDARLGGAGGGEFVGLENYAELLGRGEFWAATWQTVVFTVSSVACEMALGLAIALIVHSSFRGRGLVRAAMLVPWALPTVVAARLWGFMFVDTYGVVNDLLVTRLGLLETKPAWLGESGLAMAAIVATDVWKTTPFVALLLLAGLQVIPEELCEAARVDGANAWERFVRVTLPLLRPILLVTLIFRTLDALRMFDVVWVMTGGSLGTEVLATYNYRELVSFQKLGFGSAVSVAVFLLIGAFVAVYVRAFRVAEDAVG